MNATAAATPTFRARIDRNTRKLVLPVPVSGLARFSIKGIWRDFATEGPDPTVVIVKARAKIAKRTIEHRLTEDASFPLPETVQHVELEVQYPSDHARLEVTITPIEPGPSARQRKLEWFLERRAA